MEDTEKNTAGPDNDLDGSLGTTDEIVNVGGHKQELDRNFNLLSLTAVGIVNGNTWASLGGSIAVAISNGGPPGVIYEFIAVSIIYFLISASLAELASAIPSSGGVYHWASVTAGRYGRICGFFAGFWNFFAWMFAAASSSAIIGNQTVQMYATYHPEFQVKVREHDHVPKLSWVMLTQVLARLRQLPHRHMVLLLHRTLCQSCPSRTQ